MALTSTTSIAETKLIINADDLGYSANRDRGIFELYRDGLITGASLLVNQLTSEESAKTAKELGLPIGLHLNLTEGKPVATDVPSLIGSDGNMLGKIGFRTAFAENKINLADVAKEIEAQLLWTRERGLVPSHADGHQHVHVMPQICDVFAQLLVKYSVLRTRVPEDDVSMPLLPPGPRRDFIGGIVLDAKAARTVFDRAGLHSTVAFVGNCLMGTNSTLENTRNAFKQIPKGISTVEWMVHPGYADQAYGDDFNRSRDREAELQNLRDAKLKDLFRELNYRLIPWSSI